MERSTFGIQIDRTRSTRSARPLAGVVAFVLVSSLVLAGCSVQKLPTSTDVEGYTIPTAEATSYPLTIDNCGEKVTIAKPPQRVVILNGASVGEVESLIALGQDKAIIGNMQGYGVSDQPGMEKKIANLPTLSATAEKILATHPDLVISTWAGGFDPAVGAPTRSQLSAQGIASYVNPAQCEPKAAATTGDQGTQPGINSSFDMLMDFGKIFNAQKAAVEYIKKSVETISHIDSDDDKKGKALIAYPDMAAMNTNGLPAVMTGGIYDDILHKAGLENSISGDKETTQTLTAEKLSAADVDVLVLGRISPDSDPQAEAERLFAAYPQWKASQEKRWVSVSDSIYYGPLNSLAVEKISRA